MARSINRTLRLAASIAIATALLFAAEQPTRAGSVRSVNIEQMTTRAATIVAGRCTDVRVELHPVLGRETTVVTIEVDHVAKGATGTTHTLRLLGANGDDGRWNVPGLPSFRPGQEVVLFLYGTSRIGLTSPVGFGQGAFEVVRDKQGRAVAINEFGNDRLFHGLSDEAAARLGPLPGGRAVTLDRLLEMTTTLTRTAP